VARTGQGFRAAQQHFLGGITMNETITRQKNDFPTLNQADFVGSVVHKYRPKENIITLTLAVGRPDNTGVDYPNITFYGENASIIDEAIDVKPGEFPRVCVSAEIQTSRKEFDDKVKYYQNIVGNELRLAPTHMEQLTGQKGLGSHKLPAQNDVRLMGLVVNVFQITRPGREYPIGTIVTLKTVSNGRVNFPKVTCFGPNSIAASALQVGDYACVTGSIQTRYNAETKTRFETIVANEIAKVEE